MNLHSRNLSSEPAASAARQGRLMDKVAVITGAASGIGKEIALAFAREGAKVVIADLDQKAAQETASEIDPLVQRALGVAMDVSNEEQVEAGMARVIETFGRLDILISNAGVQIVAPLVEFEFAKWKKLLSIHLDGAFLTTRAALRQMYQAEERQHHLHGVRALQGGITPQGSLRHRQARSGRPGQGRGEGGGRPWGPRERDLPGLRPHAAGREANPGAGARARDL